MKIRPCTQEEVLMKRQKPLSELFQLYVAGDLSKKDFEGRIFQFLFDNFERFRHFNGDRDCWSEFLSWLYPRFARAIDLYRDLGSSFDAYIFSLVHFASREYRCREADHRITEYICWQAKAEEMRVCEEEGEYPEVSREISIPEGIKPRQILLLLLKSYYYVTDEYVKRVACAIGMNSEEVLNMVDELRKRRNEKEAKILEYRERLYCQHYRCLAYQKRMNTATQGTAYHGKMKGRYERAKRRYLAMKDRLGGMRLDASNQMIAEVLGIPKGTVDSGLYSVKNHLAPYMEKAAM